MTRPSIPFCCSHYSIEELRCQDLGIATSGAGIPALGTATAIGTSSGTRRLPAVVSLSTLVADAAAEHARVDAWNAQPLGSWTFAQLCDRAFAPEYDLDDALNTHVKMVVASTIESKRLAGRDLNALVDAIRAAKSASSSTSDLLAAWLPDGCSSSSQIEVQYIPCFYIALCHHTIDCISVSVSAS